MRRQLRGLLELFGALTLTGFGMATLCWTLICTGIVFSYGGLSAYGFILLLLIPLILLRALLLHLVLLVAGIRSPFAYFVFGSVFLFAGQSTASYRMNFDSSLPVLPSTVIVIAGLTAMTLRLLLNAWASEMSEPSEPAGKLLEKLHPIVIVVGVTIVLYWFASDPKFIYGSIDLITSDPFFALEYSLDRPLMSAFVLFGFYGLCQLRGWSSRALYATFGGVAFAIAGPTYDKTRFFIAYGLDRFNATYLLTELMIEMISFGPLGILSGLILYEYARRRRSSVAA